MKEQMNPEPIRWRRVDRAVQLIRYYVDLDDMDNHRGLKKLWETLTNDEQIEVNDLLKDKAPDSGPRGRAYRSILKDYLSYVSDS